MQFATAKARRDPGQHQPGVPHARAAPTRSTSPGCRLLIVGATSFKTSDYAAMVAEVRRALPDLEHVVFLGTPDWDELLAAGDRVATGELASRARPSLRLDDPINIQYTSGTTGFPKGATLTHRNILNNGYFVGEGCGYTEADRVCIPVPFYHCFGMVIGNLACTTHGATIVMPAPSFEPAATLRGRRGGAVHEPATACRRCSSPSSAIPTFARLRPVVAAHRDDGRLAVPGRGDEAVHRRDAHGRGDHLLRHDRDVAGVDADRARRPARPAGRHRRPGAPARRGQDRRPGDRARRSSRAASPASCAPAATR